jgi:hypothetical protein
VLQNQRSDCNWKEVYDNLWDYIDVYDHSYFCIDFVGEEDRREEVCILGVALDELVDNFIELVVFGFELLEFVFEYIFLI